jgi:hypothetical protein
MSVLAAVANGDATAALEAAKRAPIGQGRGYLPERERGRKCGTYNPYAQTWEHLVRSGRVIPKPGYLLLMALFPQDWDDGEGIDKSAAKGLGDARHATWFEVLRVGAGAEEEYSVGDYVTFVAASADLVDPSGEDKRWCYVDTNDTRARIELASELPPDA